MHEISEMIAEMGVSVWKLMFLAFGNLVRSIIDSWTKERWIVEMTEQDMDQLDDNEEE